MSDLFFAFVIFLALIVGVPLSLTLMATRGQSSSREDQRRHDAEYAPVRDVYIVLQTTNHYTTYEEHTHQIDQRSVNIYGQEPEVGTGRIEDTQGYTGRSLPRQRKALGIPR